MSLPVLRHPNTAEFRENSSKVTGVEGASRRWRPGSAARQAQATRWSRASLLQAGRGHEHAQSTPRRHPADDKWDPGKPIGDSGAETKPKVKLRGGGGTRDKQGCRTGRPAALKRQPAQSKDGNNRGGGSEEAQGPGGTERRSGVLGRAGGQPELGQGPYIPRRAFFSPHQQEFAPTPSPWRTQALWNTVDTRQAPNPRGSHFEHE